MGWFLQWPWEFKALHMQIQKTQQVMNMVRTSSLSLQRNLTYYFIFQHHLQIANFNNISYKPWQKQAMFITCYSSVVACVTCSVFGCVFCFCSMFMYFFSHPLSNCMMMRDRNWTQNRDRFACVYSICVFSWVAVRWALRATVYSSIFRLILFIFEYL